MNKIILTVVALTSLAILLTSCSGISQEEYNKVNTDLAAAQAQTQSLEVDLSKSRAQVSSLQGDLAKANTQIGALQSNLDAANNKRAEALAYAELLDILMYPEWKQAGITPRFNYKDEVEWLVALNNKATTLKDDKVTNYIKEIQNKNKNAFDGLWDYCLDRIEKASK